jgi:hypothetical protein
MPIVEMTPSATLPDKIAAWVTKAHGIKINPDQVAKTDIRNRTVAFQLRHINGNMLADVYQIQTKRSGSTDLVEPPVHVHEMVIRRFGDAPACRCGKRPNDLSTSEKKLADMGDPSDAAKASLAAVQAQS